MRYYLERGTFIARCRLIRQICDIALQVVFHKILIRSRHNSPMNTKGINYPRKPRLPCLSSISRSETRTVTAAVLCRHRNAWGPLNHVYTQTEKEREIDRDRDNESERGSLSIRH